MPADHEDHRAPDLLTNMQDVLLPTGVAVLPRVDVAARYLLSDDAWAGGDWFDAVPLSGGRVALVVGDVVGRGASAAGMMGQLRAVLVACLLAEQEPLPALETLDLFAVALPEARGTTVAVAVLDPDRHVVRYCTAGSPPPLVVRPDGQGVFLPVTGSGPLGCGTTFRTAERWLSPGDLVLLYSDGLVMRRGVRPGVGMSQLLGVAAEAAVHRTPTVSASAVDRVCEITLERLIGGTGVEDDITVVAGQLLGVPEPSLALDLPALPDAVRVVRLELGSWLGALRLSAIDQLALQHAVGELVSNVVQHAYPDGSSAHDTSVRIRTMVSDDGFVVVDVQDDGTWRSPGAAGPRHRGLAMASGFVDYLDPVPSTHGTHMRVRHRALRPACLLAQDPWPRRRRGGGNDVLRIEVGSDGGLQVSGALDHLAVDRLAAALRSSDARVSEPLDVDLSAATVLCSRAVRVLLDAVAAGRRPGHRPVVLHAASGSVAQHVLDLVQLPYEESEEDASA